jgi:hypothetical protein
MLIDHCLCLHLQCEFGKARALFFRHFFLYDVLLRVVQQPEQIACRIGIATALLPVLSTPSLINCINACSKVCEPADILFSIASLICVISPFSISSANVRRVEHHFHRSARPPSMAPIRRCDTTARSVDERSVNSD